MVWTCVRVISESVAVLPRKVYRRVEGGRELAESHWLHDVVNFPNDEQDGLQFWEQQVGHLCGGGNSYAEIVRDRRGQPAELLPLLPDRTRPERVNGVKVLKSWVRRSRGAGFAWDEEILPPGRYLHITGLSYNGLKGYSPIHVMRESIGWGLALQKYSAGFFARGINPKMAVIYEREVRDRSETKRNLEAQHAGLDRAHGHAP